MGPGWTRLCKASAFGSAPPPAVPPAEAPPEVLGCGGPPASRVSPLFHGAPQNPWIPSVFHQAPEINLSGIPAFDLDEADLWLGHQEHRGHLSSVHPFLPPCFTLLLRGRTADTHDHRTRRSRKQGWWQRSLPLSTSSIGCCAEKGSVSGERSTVID